MSLLTIADGEREENWEEHGHLFRGFSDAYERFMDERDDHVRPAGVHASEITGCLRSAAYTMTATEKKGIIGRIWRKKFEHGHWVHAGIQAAMHEMDGKFDSYQFEDEVRINPDNNAVAADWNIFSSCDGVITFFKNGNPIARMGLEIKTESAAQFEKLTEPRDYHLDQVHVYMACLDLPATWLMYYNKGNENITPSAGPFLVKYTPMIWSRVVDRIVELNALIEAGKLPPRKEGIWCEWCKYAWTCRPSWRRSPRDRSGEMAMLQAGMNVETRAWKRKGSR